VSERNVWLNFSLVDVATYNHSAMYCM